MNYEQFLSRFEFKRKTAKGFMVVCPAHDDSRKSPSLSVGRADDGGVLLKCFAGCATDSVVKSLGLTMSDLFAAEKFKPFTPPRPKMEAEKAAPDVKPEIEKIYSYRNRLGEEVYQAIRMKPKSFRQRHKDGGGNWVWTMENVERVLYNLPEVLKADTVWIVEGEKDADNLMELGITATCNVGGAGKWLDGYTESLAGKNIVICGDNDEPGQKHAKLVFESVSAKAKSVRVIKLPGIKDASDYISKFKQKPEAKTALDEIANNSVPHVGGVSLPIYSMADIEPLYKQQVMQAGKISLDLGAWLPSFRMIRPLIQGEFALILGDTGTGKTGILQNIAVSNSHLKTLMFEMELPSELLFERYLALRGGFTSQEVETEYKNNDVFGEKAMMLQFPNLFICPQSKITLDQMESMIMRAELKMGERPVLVLVDYVQLISGAGNRYEKTSNIAEGLKVLAKSTRTIIVATSQVARNEDGEIGLHSAKDSGSLENSAGLVLGAWRDKEDFSLLKMRVLKSTKGGAGLEIDCNFDGARMKITERSKIPALDA
jgi:5S rRNA maturation endonuclease (ribonuclease M5)